MDRPWILVMSVKWSFPAMRRSRFGAAASIGCCRRTGGRGMWPLGSQMRCSIGLTGDFVQESAGHGFAWFAPFAPRECQGERQQFLGARDADVTESSLLVDGRAIFIDAAMVRQDSFFHADHIDLWELQAFGAVQGHQRDGTATQLVLLVVVELAAGQSHFVEENAERSFLGWLLASNAASALTTSWTVSHRDCCSLGSS